MTRQISLCLLAGLLAFSVACERKAPPPDPGLPPRQNPNPPVVDTPPVLTRPYEDGYEAGIVAGEKAAKPGAKIPERPEVLSAAEDAEKDAAEPSEKWRQGWTDGYLDGFRRIAKGLR